MLMRFPPLSIDGAAGSAAAATSTAAPAAAVSPPSSSLTRNSIALQLSKLFDDGDAAAPTTHAAASLDAAGHPQPVHELSAGDARSLCDAGAEDELALLDASTEMLANQLAAVCCSPPRHHHEVYLS